MWGSAVAEGNLESAEQPGTAADIWSAGCVVAEVCMKTIYTCIKNNCQEVVCMCMCVLTKRYDIYVLTKSLCCVFSAC